MVESKEGATGGFQAYISILGGVQDWFTSSKKTLNKQKGHHHCTAKGKAKVHCLFEMYFWSSG